MQSFSKSKPATAVQGQILTAEEINAISGGLNPQPLPPRVEEFASRSQVSLPQLAKASSLQLFA